MERVQASTHNGTHLDAPYHYHSTMDGGKRAITIDEVPLDWCIGRGVKLDFPEGDATPTMTVMVQNVFGRDVDLYLTEADSLGNPLCPKPLEPSEIPVELVGRNT